METEVAPKINHTESIELGQYAMPARGVSIMAEEKQARVERAVGRLASVVESVKPRLIKKMAKFTAQISPRETSLGILNEEMEQSFKSERPAFEKQKAKLEEELKILRSDSKKSAQEISGKFVDAIEKVKSRFSSEQQFLSSVVKSFPDAQILHRTSVHAFTNSQGLPALALFDPHREFSVISVTSRGADLQTMERGRDSGTRNHSEWFGERICAEIGVAICNATGIVPHTDRSNHYSPALQQAINGRLQFPDGRKHPGYADEIILEASFSEGGRTIPRAAREIIRKAERSGLFDKVLLLSEVQTWKIKYVDPNSNPKPLLEGEVIHHLRSRDPLIVGFKKLEDNRRYAVVVGKFDTTRIEELIHAEFCTKP